MFKVNKFALSTLVLFCVSSPLVSWAGEVNNESAKLANNSPLAAAISWQQSSAEYKALCHQTYNIATQVIDEHIRNGAYVKIDGKLCEESFCKLEDGCVIRYYRPLAIVLDIDETVVDNCGVEAWCVRNGLLYTPEIWSAWCKYQGDVPGACREVPGAVNFLKHCLEVGVTPIYLTNRSESEREDTLHALINLGLDNGHLNDCLILRDSKRDKREGKALLGFMGEKEDSGFAQEILNNQSDKAGRRIEIQTRYKVLGWFGDNLYDMPVLVHYGLKDGREVLEARDAEVKEHVAELGRTFFMLPNPIYGSWLKKQTVPADNMASGMDDYGFGKWYEQHKGELKGKSGR
ncbi:hypothetical protein IJT10_04960 [bacterium]|nr:hypothetical protein [bacterium]